MAKKILIMGLPGSGKTTLAHSLKQVMEDNGINTSHFNADIVRKEHNDWDFSHEGRIRQSQRMRESADAATTDYVIADFVAPLNAMRTNFDADWTVWVDTIKQSRFADTDVMFMPPTMFEYDFRVTKQAADQWSETIAKGITAKTELGVQ